MSRAPDSLLQEEAGKTPTDADDDPWGAAPEVGTASATGVGFTRGAPSG